MIKQKIIDLGIKIKSMLEDHSKIVLGIMFIIAVLIYGYLVSKVTSISYLQVDEELYISMARSFFYEGVFSKGYEILNYNCVLYSILISIVYFFYSAENVLFTMRIIGVILLASTVFPVYLLSKRVLNSKIKSIGIALIGILLPEMGLSAYVIQEVLLYPVFLWTAYLIYVKFTTEKSKILDIGIILLLAIMFFIKSYAISFALAYFGTLFIIDKKASIKNIIKQGIIFILIIAICYLGIYVINNFQTGVNHYSTQISTIFPITINTIINFVHGIWYYTIMFVFCAGILPIIMPILNIKKYEKNDSKFVIFLILASIMTIIETALIVFIPEESNKLYPYKFCYRYLFVLMLPFLVMLMKLKKEEIKINKKLIIIYGIIFAYLIWYYIGQGAKLTIIDAPMLFCIQYVYKKFLGLALMITFLIISIGMLVLHKKNLKYIKTTYIEIMVLCSLILSLQYWRAIISQSNNDILGRILKPDFITISESIGRDYDRVYIAKGNGAVMTISGQLRSECKYIDIRRRSKYRK